MDGIPWSRLVQWTAWAIAMGFAMRWYARSQRKPLAKDQVGSLRQPTATLNTGVVGLLFFAALAVLSNVYANATSNWIVTTVFASFAALSLLLIAEYYRGRHRLSEEGLEYGRLLGAGGALRWDELKRVRYSPGMQWFCLETASGEVARVSGMVRGLDEFARNVLRCAPPEAIEPATLPVLKAVAEGRSLMMGLPEVDRGVDAR